MYQKETVKKCYPADYYKSDISADDTREQWDIAWVRSKSIGLVTQSPKHRRQYKERHFKRIHMVKHLKSAFWTDDTLQKWWEDGDTPKSQKNLKKIKKF